MNEIGLGVAVNSAGTTSNDVSDGSFSQANYGSGLRNEKLNPSMGVPGGIGGQQQMHQFQQQHQQQQQQQQQQHLLQQQQQQQQQQQRLLMQQKLRQQQQQQAVQNYENQFYQFLMTINKKPKRLYNFAEDTDSILKKYEQFRPSFEFHIYENNYKICAPANTRLQQQQRMPQATSDGLILNKNNETLKEFLEYVARGSIPEAIMEVLKDCNIQFYEGNMILQVYDHTNTVDVKQTQKAPSDPSQAASATSSDHAASMDSKESVKNASGQQSDSQGRPPSQQSIHFNESPATSSAPKPGSTDEQANSTAGTETTPQENGNKEVVATFKRPRVYRTLLRPSSLTHYYDMMSYADHTRFSDNIYQQLESEILTLTKRNLKLNVPLNPFEYKDRLDDADFLSKKELCHRELSTRKGTKSQVGHIDLHEESPQHSSSYEQMMLIMSERTSTTTTSTIAASLAKSAADLTSTSLKSGGGKGAASASSSTGRGSGSNSVAAAAVAAAAAVGSSSNDNNQFSRLKFVEQWRANKEKRKQQAMNANVTPTTYNQRISMSAPLTAQQIKQQQQQTMEQQRGVNKRPGDEEKNKPKKQRKTTKKATPAVTPDPAKKKKAPKTKK
ncbi:Spt20p LALA0_S02e05644g [Lachancea lanzarotensis]|uniref:LALA0S02e05644g1_1 n=1 Tax=Lachancea lanzarotensis TaxID=1245769 RepID=A0A0C7MZN4_9SACH|nr:uncharacterized protein LALA0_S02e05644g [Lachancea lanzarotensis]CEP61051.1 LALA0S02e05644g1_1 [Lachancea lanzarotensis]